MHGFTESSIMHNTIETTNSNNKGFTLVELLITIVMIGIMTTIATPLMRDWAKESEVKTMAEHVSSILDQASNAAHQTSERVLVVPLNATDWTSGLKVCLDKDKDNQCDADDGAILAESPFLGNSIVVNVRNSNGSATNTLFFAPNGFSGTLVDGATGVDGYVAGGDFVISTCVDDGSKYHKRQISRSAMGVTAVVDFKAAPKGQGC